MVRTHSYSRHRIAATAGRFVMHVILILLGLAFVLPFVLVVSASISDNQTVLRSGYRFYPVGLSLEAYRFIFTDATQILNSYRVTIVVTVSGTIGGLLLSSMLSYALARRGFPLRKLFAFIVYFTMLFNGGLVPYYLLVTQILDLEDTLGVLIIPGLVVPFYVLIMRTYFAQLPEELLDAARVDGAGEWRIYFQIALPLSTPMLAAIGLFLTLMYWNDWFTPLLFIRKAELTPLQYLLHRIMADLQFLTTHMSRMPGYSLPPMPLGTIRMALTVLAAAPIAIMFLFLQRYFVSGLTIGAFKG